MIKTLNAQTQKKKRRKMANKKEMTIFLLCDEISLPHDLL